MEQTRAGSFFHDFADRFDSFYDGRRGRAMRWIDRRFRRDMFVRYAMTFERLGDLRGLSGIDIGCGSGPYSEEALRRGAAHVTLLDPARGMLDLAVERIRKLGHEDRIEVVEGYFPSKAPSRRFDFAIVMGVMDYVADAPAFLKGLRDVVKGAAVVSFPSRHWFRTPLRRIRYYVRNCPLYFYDADRIRSLGRKAGFADVDVVKIEGAGMDYHVRLRP